MSEQVAIEVGDKFHIITRRLFEGDTRRHFAGELTGISDNLQKLMGYTFVFNRGTNEYKKRPEVRTRIFSLGQADFIVNKIPREVEIDSLEYRIKDKRLVITDSREFFLDINEFGSSA